MQEHPLTYEVSAGQTHLQVTNTLPAEVVQCLKNARFVCLSDPNFLFPTLSANFSKLHLATCTDFQPHVSLMNYTYLPSTPYSPFPTIIMTTNPSSKKTHNLVSNPNVSLLVHDWVSHRPPVTTPSAHQNDCAGSPPAETSQSSLATLLANLNTSALSSISATINGTARLVERGTEEETYLREKHLENNTFEDGERKEGLQDSWNVGGEVRNGHGDGGRGCFIEGEEVRVVVVRIRDGRVADWKGGVRDWCLSSEENGRGDGTLVNGV
jgi:hypothetical protein